MFVTEGVPAVAAREAHLATSEGVECMTAEAGFGPDIPPPPER